MVQNKKGLRRFLSVLLCMSALLLACACASEQTDISTPAGTQESSNTLAGAISEVDANISAGEEISVPGGDVSIEPTDPVLPEKRETVVELVHTFETGEDGLFSYSFLIPEDRGNPYVSAPVLCCADAHGNVYTATSIDGRKAVVCLTTGDIIYVESQYNMMDMLCCDGFLYILLFNGELRSFSLENTELVETKQLFPTDSNIYGLLDIGKSEPILEFFDRRMYSLELTALTGADLPYAVSEQSGTSAVDRAETGAGTYLLYTDNEQFFAVENIHADGIMLSDGQRLDTKSFSVMEQLYSSYDTSGNLVSQFLYREESAEDVECDIPYSAGVVTSHSAVTVTVERTVFENVMESRVVNGEDGGLFLVLYYANYGEIYEITPGYSGVGLTDLTASTETEEEGSIAPMSIAIEEYQYVMAERANARLWASYIMQTPWTITNAHKVERPKTALPKYLESATGAQIGIPYCWGGFHDRDEFISLVNTTLSGTYSRYMTGDVECAESYKQPGTIGLDCSGFVGRVYQVFRNTSSKPSTGTLAGYGHAVDSLDNLFVMDLLVLPEHHAMMYAGQQTLTEVYVFDTSTDSDSEMTNARWIDIDRVKPATGYLYIHPFGAYQYNASTHWAVCATCGDYSSVAGEHTYGTTYSSDSTHHWRSCDICGYVQRGVHLYKGTLNCVVCGQLNLTALRSLQETETENEGSATALPEDVYMTLSAEKREGYYSA